MVRIARESTDRCRRDLSSGWTWKSWSLGRGSASARRWTSARGGSGQAQRRTRSAAGEWRHWRGRRSSPSARFAGTRQGVGGRKPDTLVRVLRSPRKRPFEMRNPEVWPLLEKLVDPVTRGRPAVAAGLDGHTVVLAREPAERHGHRHQPTDRGESPTPVSCNPLMQLPRCSTPRVLLWATARMGVLDRDLVSTR